MRPGPIRLAAGDVMLLLLIQLIDLYTIMVLAAVVLTWIRLSPGNPVLQFIQMLTEPVLAPARRIIPPLGGLDISPMLVMIALQAIRSVLVRSF
jgi:YggT family protein